jgi:manganese transport protein
MRPWLRRLITRSLAIIPAALVAIYYGDEATGSLLVFSQVVLGLQLPFAVIPLIMFTSDKTKMGRFATPLWMKLLAWLTAAVIVSLNIYLLILMLGKSGWFVGMFRTAVQ